MMLLLWFLFVKKSFYQNCLFLSTQNTTCYLGTYSGTIYQFTLESFKLEAVYSYSWTGFTGFFSTLVLFDFLRVHSFFSFGQNLVLRILFRFLAITATSRTHLQLLCCSFAQKVVYPLLPYSITTCF